MSFTELEKTILAEATKRVEAIRQQYGQQYAQEEERIRERARAAEEQIIEEARETGGHERRRLHQNAQLAARADILQAKQDALQQTRDEALAAILAWDEARTRRLLEALLARVPEDEGVIVPGEHHRALVEQLMNTAVTAESIVGDGGFVYRGETMELNLTISHLVDQLLVRHRTEVAQALFG